MHWWQVGKRLALHEAPEPVVDDPAGDPPADPAADPAAGGGDPPSPALSADVLPEELKGLPEAEVKFHLNQMVRGIQAQNTRNRELEDRLRNIEATVPREPVEPAEPAKPLEELILEDPEAAVMQVLENRGLTQRFDRVEEQAGESAFTVVAGKTPGFEDHEDDIRTIMRESGVPATVANITGALHMAVGRKTLEDNDRATRAAATAQIPANDPPTPTTGPIVLTGLEKEIQEASGMDPEEYTKYKDAQNFDIKVPTS